MPFPHATGRMLIESAWMRIKPDLLGASVVSCPREVPPRICLQVRDAVTLGPLSNVTVHLGAIGRPIAPTSFVHNNQNYGIRETAKTDSEGWVRFGGKQSGNILTELESKAESWAVEVVIERPNLWTAFQSADAPESVRLRASASPIKVYSTQFHAVFDVLVDWAAPELPADLDQVVRDALQSPLRLYVDDGANFGNQAAAFFLLQTLHAISGNLGQLPLTIHATNAILMGEEESVFTILRPLYRQVVFDALPRDERTPEQLEEARTARLNVMLTDAITALEQNISPALAAIFRDESNTEGILPDGVVRSTEVVPAAFDADWYRTQVAIRATGIYDNLAGLGGESIAKRLFQLGLPGTYLLYDNGKRRFYSFGATPVLPEDFPPALPATLARGCAFDVRESLDGEEEFDEDALYVRLECRAVVQPYQRTIRSRFDIICHGSPMAQNANLSLKFVAAFDQHDDDAIGLVAACDDSSLDHLETLCKDRLATNNAVFLQPYGWKRDRLGLSGRAPQGTTREALSLPPEAAYLLAAEDGSTPLLDAIRTRAVPLMIAYGLHQAHETTTDAIYTQLATELLHLHDSIGGEIILVVIFRGELPVLPNGLSGRMRFSDGIDAAALPAYHDGTPLLIVKLTSLSNLHFTQFVNASTLPVVLEGANTMNMALRLGKPILSVSTHTTKYPKLACGGAEDLYGAELEKMTGLLREEIEQPEPRPARSPGPLENPVLSHYFERVLQDGTWRDYFLALKGFIAHDRHNQVKLALYRLQVRRGKRKIARCPCQPKPG